MKPHVILWRHGQTDHNLQGRFQGQVDIPLNNTGFAQACEAAEVLAATEPRAIISSDLIRAAQTAEVLGELIGVDVSVDERLRERSFGEWEGLTREQIEERWPAAFVAWRHGEQPAGLNVESQSDLAERIASSVREWSSKFEISDTVIFVAHGAAITTGISAILGQDPAQSRGIAGLGNCHWSTLVTTRAHPGWRLTSHNVGVQG